MLWINARLRLVRAGWLLLLQQRTRVWFCGKDDLRSTQCGASYNLLEHREQKRVEALPNVHFVETEPASVGPHDPVVVAHSKNSPTCVRVT